MATTDFHLLTKIAKTFIKTSSTVPQNKEMKENLLGTIDFHLKTKTFETFFKTSFAVFHRKKK